VESETSGDVKWSEVEQSVTQVDTEFSTDHFQILPSSRAYVYLIWAYVEHSSLLIC